MQMAHPSSSTSKPHIVVFPFMSKGHTIPLLHLVRLLLRRNVAVTVFTTPANHPFVSDSLPSDPDISIVDLPFPNVDAPEIPRGVESTDKLPSMSLFIPFVNATKLMQPFFEKSLEHFRKHLVCIISDAFLHWTLQSASKLGVPRLAYYGMSYYAMALSRAAAVNGLLSSRDSDDEPFTVTGFPWIELCRNDFDEPLCKKDPRGPHWDFIVQASLATSDSYGVLVNSFYELERTFADHWAREGQPRAWSIGPLCLASPTRIEVGQKPKWVHWLDQKLAQNSPVLYVAFGSQAKVPPAQLREIASGLEDSNTAFLWVSKEKMSGDCEERVEGRGIFVNEWVDQREILEHPIVQGFLSHCGWNSVLEGMCARVPILAWPMMAEQYLNAKFVVEEINVGLRVKTVDGLRKGFVSGGSLKSDIVELMGGEKGRQLRENVNEVAEGARTAVADGGSSWLDLNRLIEETRKQKEINGC